MTSERWLFDEAAHAGPEHLDPTSVAGYDAKAGVDPSEDIALLQRLGLDRSSVLIDMGAGTGTFSLAVAPLCRRVVAVDIAPAMVERMASRRRELGLDNVEISQAGFLTYEHTGELADFVYCRNALHRLPDFWKALALVRMAAMLRPGAFLRLRDLVYQFDPLDARTAIDEWLHGATDRPEEGWTRSELEAHISSGFSTFGWLLEPMLERAGSEIQESSHAVGIYARFVCTTSSERATAGESSSATH